MRWLFRLDGANRSRARPGPPAFPAANRRSISGRFRCWHVLHDLLMPAAEHPSRGMFRARREEGTILGLTLVLFLFLYALRRPVLEADPWSTTSRCRSSASRKASRPASRRVPTLGCCYSPSRSARRERRECRSCGILARGFSRAWRVRRRGDPQVLATFLTIFVFLPKGALMRKVEIVEDPCAQRNWIAVDVKSGERIFGCTIEGCWNECARPLNGKSCKGVPARTRRWVSATAVVLDHYVSLELGMMCADSWIFRTWWCGCVARYANGRAHIGSPGSR